MILQDITKDKCCQKDGASYAKLIKYGIKKIGKPQYLWHSNYWDGPLSGVCEYKNKKCWFDCVDEMSLDFLDEYGDEDFDRVRIFVVLELSHKEYKKLAKSHNLFRRYIGTHTDYIGASRVWGGPPSFWLIRLLRKPLLKWFKFNVNDLYYKRKNKPANFQYNNILAWYGDNDDFDFNAYLMQNLLK